MARILAPNKQYSGISASVKFVNGEGFTTNEYLISWFKSHGYDVILDAAEEGLEVPTPDADMRHKELEDMTKAELEEVAKAYGVVHNSKTTKEDLVKLIKEKAGYTVED